MSEFPKKVINTWSGLAGRIWGGLVRHRTLVLSFFLMALFVHFTLWGYLAFTDGNSPLPVFSDVIAFLIILIIGIFLLGAITLALGALRDYLRRYAIEHSQDPNHWLYNFLLLLTGIIVLYTAYTTWYGFKTLFFSVGDGWARSNLLPLSVAMIAGGGVFALWAMAFHMMQLSCWKKRIGTLALLLLLGAPFITSISTYTSVLGVAGDSAIRHHMLESISIQEASINRVIPYRDQEKSLHRLLLNYSREFTTMAEDEASAGEFSGIQGEGSVARFLQRMSRSLRETAQTIENSISRVNQVGELLRTDLHELREEINNRKIDSIKNLERDFIAKSVSFQVELAKLAEPDSLDAVAAHARTMDAFTLGGKLSADANVAILQEEAIRKLRNSLDSASAEIEKEVARLKARDVPILPTYQAIGPGIAVLTYWKQHVSAWAVAFAADFIMLPFVFMSVLVGLNPIKKPGFDA